MIEIKRIALSADLSRLLQYNQDKIDGESDYAKRVELADKEWGKKSSRLSNGVREILTEMCAGSQRCMYCEDSCADEIEHISPKTFYPEYVFVWENYLYACGQCNGGKNNRFAIFLASGEDHEIPSRKKGDPIVQPPSGEPLFLNPFDEDPLVYLALDLTDTFELRPMPGLSPKLHRRADYTCDVLRLNRGVLKKARREAYDSYRARLREYVEDKRRPAPQIELDKLIHALQHMQHPTVWREMKRQQTRIPKLKELFDLAPEALEW